MTERFIVLKQQRKKWFIVNIVLKVMKIFYWLIPIEPSLRGGEIFQITE